ncbi:MAG: hypothetical protein ACKV19_07940 [Verrucomicrobiales bacterium]
MNRSIPAANDAYSSRKTVIGFSIGTIASVVSLVMVPFSLSDVLLALMAGAFAGAGMIHSIKKGSQSGLSIIFASVLVLQNIARSLNPQSSEIQFPVYPLSFACIAMSIGSGVALAYRRIRKAG